MDKFAFHLAQLRHAYSQLLYGTKIVRKSFADGLLAPAIECFEKDGGRQAALREVLAMVGELDNESIGAPDANALAWRADGLQLAQQLLINRIRALLDGGE